MKILNIQDSFEDSEQFWLGLREPNENQELYELSHKDPRFKKIGKHYEFDNGTKYTLSMGKYIKMNNVSSVSKLDNDLILGYKDGSLSVYNLTSGENTNIPECHFLDIEEIKVFPSKEVILTRGLDNQIKLWSIKQWKNIRIMKSLFSSNVELIGKGRNFLVGNKNGEVEMWECGSNSIVYRFSKVKNKHDPVKVIKVIEDHEDEGEDKENEFETKGKSVIVGYESGEIRKFNLFTKQLTLLMNVGSEITDLEYTTELIVGTKGKLFIGDKQLELNDEDVKFKVGDYLYVYNGEETLLKISKDLSEITYLVGLPEFFKVEDMVMESQLIVASDYGIIMYEK